ncbi:hypothetical protein [Demequina sp.]|uniref:hypothetical protein n=1 Tax=Demequina sp. TaxID=2050685 RepID=UPI0025BE77C2|nr:hypothetical protein [Demequina sp.]
MTQYQRAAWFAAVLVTLVAFGVLIPQFPSWGDESIALEVDTEVGMATASVVVPAGWDLDIAASSQQTPVASKSGIEVTVADAVWLGDSQDLLASVSRLLFDGDAILPEIPPEPVEAEEGATREVWRLTPKADAAPDLPVRVDVIRDAEGVVLVVVRGEAAQVNALSEQLDSIVESVHLDLSPIDVEVSS